MNSGARYAQSEVTGPGVDVDSSSPSSSSSQASDALPSTSWLHVRSRVESADVALSTSTGVVDASSWREAGGASSTRPAHATTMHARRAAAGATNDLPMIVLNALLRMTIRMSGNRGVG